MIGRLRVGLFCLAMLCIRSTDGRGADSAVFEALARDYDNSTRPLVQQYCLKCHSTEKQEGDLDLEQFTKFEMVRRSPRIWQKVVEMLDNGEMPPKKSPQLSDPQRKSLRNWIGSYLIAEAQANAGDPGSVVLRRLSHVEYDNTTRDLLGVDLHPGAEFPVDGAAGEGFTNAGEALVMSPAMLDKYVAAAKMMASHAVLLPDGFRFSNKATRRDWTDEIAGQIRQIYAAHTNPEGTRRVNLQGLDILAEAGGRIPLEPYLTATLQYRDLVKRKSIADFALEKHLSPKYLEILWKLFNETSSSSLIDTIRLRWRALKGDEVGGLANEIREWQTSLTMFNSVAHFKPWLEAVNPLVESQAIRVKLPAVPNSKEILVQLISRSAVEGSEGQYVEWKEPRLEAPGRPALLLRDLRDGLRGRESKRKTLANAAKYLIAIDDAKSSTSVIDTDAFAKERQLDPIMLAAWFDYLGIVRQGPLNLDGLFTERTESAGAFGFVKTWGPGATPNISANPSDKAVYIPGTIKPHSVAVHPSPTLNVAVGWRSPIEGMARVEARVVHAHAACGNGVTWWLELRRGRERRRLAGGSLDLGKTAKIDPIENLVLHPNDLLSIIVGARDANHACDLTEIDLTIQEKANPNRKWNLARDVSGDLHSANPHADAMGNRDIWSFYTEKTTLDSNPTVTNIPKGSVLDRWREQPSRTERDKLANEVQNLLTRSNSEAKIGVDAALYEQLVNINGPLFSRLDFARLAAEVKSKDEILASREAFGLARETFGKHPSGRTVAPTSLIAGASSIIELRLPADLVAGSEFVATTSLAENEGSAQARVVVGSGPIIPGLVAGSPILVAKGSKARPQVEKALDDFRQVFPAAVCYSQIVPVDEVVTLVLFHREDEALRRLFLEESDTKRLDRLWDDLRYISQDAVKVQEAYGQFMEYVTQDGDVRIFEPLRKPIAERADALRKRLALTEPVHLEALLDFASKAYRRPLGRQEQVDLRALYANLRKQNLDHNAAFQLALTRILMAPSFLYKAEQPAGKAEAKPVSEWELASRLSYLLWSSMPDNELRQLASLGKLHDPDVLATQVRRMLNDRRVRSLSTEFACQWLDIRGFDTHNEKSERVFPQFAGLRSAMYEESVRFFEDLFQRNGSILDVLDADHTFVNEALAQHYGIPGVSGPEWRRVDGVKSFGRGGILGMSTLLSRQSGASRTSPILRGNWLAEMLLGEKLPKPPKNVPLLPESELDTNGLTLRQITEKHREVASCAKCHDRIDPFGFALEGFDAIGRRRTNDLAGRPIDTKVKLKDGTEFSDISGLREYVLSTRRDEYLNHFCRKLLGYALGRSVQLSDNSLLAEIRENLVKNHYHVQSALMTVIQSPQFQRCRGLESSLDQEATNP